MSNQRSAKENRFVTGKNAISWRSCQHEVATLSSTELQYVRFCSGTEKIHMALSSLVRNCKSSRSGHS